MNQYGFPILSLLVYLPLLGAIPIAFFARRDALLTRTWALLVSLVVFALSLALIPGFELGVSAPQFVERAPWVPTLGIEYFMGVDGISLLMVLLTTFLTVVAIIGGWNEIGGEHAKEYAGFLLLLETGLLGSFVSLDLALFFVFWEAMLVPMYLLVGICGGPRRIYATYKFFIYTAVGSLLMLIGILYVYFLHISTAHTATFDILQLTATPVPAAFQLAPFLAFALAFGIKVPIWPLHTWLPDLYTSSPLGALVLATTLVKVGAYGFLRFAIPLFPSAAASAAPYLAALGLVGIIYGGLAALAQRDLVRVIAYSSVAHLGFIVLGIFALNHQGFEGAVVQMVNHGISAGALFLVAAMILARTQTTDFSRLGGIAARWPVLGAFALLAMLSSVGLPGLNGFVGEFLIIFGTFESRTGYAVVAVVGIVIAAAYLLSMYRRAMHGPVIDFAGYDLSLREIVVMIPLAVLIVGIGLYPAPMLQSLEASVTHLTQQANPVQQTHVPASQRALANNVVAMGATYGGR